MKRSLYAVFLALLPAGAGAQGCDSPEGLVPRSCVDDASFQGYRDGFADACTLSGGRVAGEGINLTCETELLSGMRGYFDPEPRIVGMETWQGALLDPRLAPGGYGGSLNLDDPVALMQRLGQAGLLERFGTEGWGVLRLYSMEQGLPLGTPDNPPAEGQADFLRQQVYILTPNPLAAQELTRAAILPHRADN